MKRLSEEDNVIRVQFGASAVEPAPVQIPEDLPSSNREKLDLFSEMVDKGTVLVTLDARHEGVIVPPQFSEELRLNLNFCHQFGIADFEYDLAGVRASLSFGGVDSFCDVPWGAVYMMRSHVENDVMVFPAEIPEELIADEDSSEQE